MSQTHLQAIMTRIKRLDSELGTYQAKPCRRSLHSKDSKQLMQQFPFVSGAHWTEQVIMFNKIKKVLNGERVTHEEELGSCKV